MAWVAKLMPKEQQFFPLFEKQAGYLVRASRALSALLQESAAGSKGTDELRGIAKESKENSIGILEGVRTTFVTPFDRVDIKALVTEMDRCLRDSVEAAHAITLFDIREFDTPLRALAEQICATAERIEQAMPLLADVDRNAGKITSLCREISSGKEKSDEHLEEALKALFERARGDAMTFIVTDKLYDRLRSMTERLAGIGDAIHDLVIDQV
jgi:uncharacterized protein